MNAKRMSNVSLPFGGSVCIAVQLSGGNNYETALNSHVLF